VCVCVCEREREREILYEKKLNVPKIYLYNINIFFRLGLNDFWYDFDNIHNIYITHHVR